MWIVRCCVSPGVSVMRWNPASARTAIGTGAEAVGGGGAGVGGARPDVAGADHAAGGAVVRRGVLAGGGRGVLWEALPPRRVHVVERLGELPAGIDGSEEDVRRCCAAHLAGV